MGNIPSTSEQTYLKLSELVALFILFLIRLQNFNISDIDEFSHINLGQISLKGPVMTQVQKGEKTSHRGDLDTQVTRTFDKEVTSPVLTLL